MTKYWLLTIGMKADSASLATFSSTNDNDCIKINDLHVFERDDDEDDEDGDCEE